METESSNPKRMWHAINTVLGRTDRPVQSKSTALEFAKFFKEKVEKFRSDTANAATPHFQESFPRDNWWVAEWAWTCDGRGSGKTNRFRTQQAIVNRSIAKYLKKVSGDVACLLAHIFNRSFENGYVPSKFKNAVVTQLLKKAGLDVDDPINFRLADIKIRQCLVWSCLDVHLNRIGTIPSVQSTYRRNHSTETVLAKVSSDIIMAADRGDVSLLALLDLNLSAAFDTVDHGILLKRLHTSHHINGLALDWFRSYLTARRESILYSGDTTSAALVLYTSDVPRVINECVLLSVVYADDTQIYSQVKQRDIPVAKVRVEDCITKVKQWFASNRILLNPSKTEAMWCTSSRRRSSFDQPSLVIDQVDIKPSLSVRDLGVQLRAELSVADLVSAVIRSGYYNIRQLRQLQALRHAAYALMLSRIDYCNSLLANAPAASTKRLQSLINMAARVRPLQIQSHNGFHKGLPALAAIQQRVDFKICSIVYKAQHDLSPIYIMEMMKPTSIIPRHQDLRSASHSELIIPKHRTKFAEHAFIISGLMA